MTFKAKRDVFDEEAMEKYCWRFAIKQSDEEDR